MCEEDKFNARIYSGLDLLRLNDLCCELRVRGTNLMQHSSTAFLQHFVDKFEVPIIELLPICCQFFLYVSCFLDLGLGLVF
jgi:hypothetical protein